MRATPSRAKFRHRADTCCALCKAVGFARSRLRSIGGKCLCANGRRTKITVFTNISLDGVMQSPARRDEDPRDGFSLGGWGAPYQAMTSAGEVMANVGALLIRRWTCESFYAVWPKRPESPYSAFMDNITKYVASRTLKEPLPWKNSVLIRGDAEDAIARLRKEQGKDIVIMGSGQLTSRYSAGIVLWRFQYSVCTCCTVGRCQRNKQRKRCRQTYPAGPAGRISLSHARTCSSCRLIVKLPEFRPSLVNTDCDSQKSRLLIFQFTIPNG